MTKFNKKISTEIIYTSVWFGLLTGLVEGILLLLLHQTGFLNWRLYNRSIWYETLWIAPLVDLVLFTLIGGIFALASWLFPRLPINRIAWFFFIFLAVFDWVFIILYGRISILPILILVLGISIQTFNMLVKREPSVLRKIHKTLPWLTGITVALFIAVQGGGWLNEKIQTSSLPEPAPDAPNVIVIVVDTLRADHLSSYGYKRETSPFIDSLAAEGVRFKDAFSSASWTQPSHASMLTGRYTYEHHAETEPLDKTYPTIGEVMQSNGYRTGAFSANTLFFTRRQGFGRGFLRFEDSDKSAADAFFNSSLYGFLFDYYFLRKALNYEGVPTRVLASEINHSVLDWIDQDHGTPFFVFLNYFDVHDPYTPPEPYRSKYASVPNPGGLINGFVERYHPDLTPEQLQSEVDAYDGSISYTDDQVKNLFDELEQRGMLENTIVIITSDHGESLGEHGLLQHSTSLYLQEIRVPLIIWGPGSVPANVQIDTPVSTTGLPSTILSLINAQKDPFPGPSLTKLYLEENAQANWPEPISEVAQFLGAAEQNPTTHGEMKSVIANNLHYIIHQKFGEELYDWREDPQEMSDLASSPGSQTALEEFRLYLESLIVNLWGS